MANRNDGNDRRQMSNIDKTVQTSMEGVEAKEVLENLTSVLQEAFDRTKGSTSGNVRQQKKLIRLSVDFIKKVIPIAESSFASATPMPHTKYATQRQSVSRKRKERMLADIADAHKMARTTDHQRLSPPESADIVALQNFAKALVTAPAILLRPNETKRTVQQPGVGSIGNQNNELTIPTPENGALYAPVEVHRILKQLEGKQRYSTIKMMIEKGTILCKTSQIYRMLKLDESELKPWWNVRGRPAILDEATLDENIKKLDTSVGMSFGRDEVRELLHSAKAKRVGKEGFVPSINVSVSEKTVKNTMALLLASNSKATDSTKKLSQRPTDDTLPIRPNQWLEKPCGSQEG